MQCNGTAHGPLRFQAKKTRLRIYGAIPRSVNTEVHFQRPTISVKLFLFNRPQSVLT